MRSYLFALISELFGLLCVGGDDGGGLEPTSACFSFSSFPATIIGNGVIPNMMNASSNDVSASASLLSRRTHGRCFSKHRIYVYLEFS